MFKKFKPTWMLEAIYQITPEQLKKHDIKAVLTDLDNTMIAWNNPDGTEELHHWIATMREAGIPVIVISNNKEERVARALKKLDLDFVASAKKPFSKGFKIVEKRYNLPKESLIMVGDQLITDIRGANSAGIRSVLVKPIVQTDAWNTRINRQLEKKIMKHLKKRHEDMKWGQELI